MKRMDSFCSDTFLEAEMHGDYLSSVPEEVSMALYLFRILIN